MNTIVCCPETRTYVQLHMIVNDRTVHSFPTRRSSDLEQVARRRCAVCGAGVLRMLEPWPRPLDRKSTRLNSSHVSISYAVFCLKKKMIISVCLTLPFYLHLEVISVMTLSSVIAQ